MLKSLMCAVQPRQKIGERLRGAGRRAPTTTHCYTCTAVADCERRCDILSDVHKKRRGAPPPPGTAATSQKPHFQEWHVARSFIVFHAFCLLLMSRASVSCVCLCVHRTMRFRSSTECQTHFIIMITINKVSNIKLTLSSRYNLGDAIS